MKKQVYKISENGYIPVVDGVKRKTLVYGKETLLSEFELAAGKTLPMHSHPEEQTGYLVSGHIVLSIGGVPHDIREGDAWIIPGDVTHGAQIIEDSVAVEVFSPVREDYLP